MAGRVPMAVHRIFEFLSGLPMALKECRIEIDDLVAERLGLGPERPPGRRLVTVPATTQAAYRTWQPQAEEDITVRWGSYIDSGSDRPPSRRIFWISDGQCEFQIGDSDRPGQLA